MAKYLKFEHTCNYKFIKNENCVCLCANCHKFIESIQFLEKANLIIGERNALEVNRKFNLIIARIENFNII